MKNYILFLIAASSVLACGTKQVESGDVRSEIVGDIEFDTLCRIAITHDQLRSEEEITLIAPNACDSIRLYFPPGGTVTSAALYTDSLMKDEICSTPTFELTPGNLDPSKNRGFMTVSSKMKGKFFLYYGSCHWGSRMWIHLK